MPAVHHHQSSPAAIYSQHLGVDIAEEDSDDSPFVPPYRHHLYNEHPTCILTQYQKLEFEQEVRTVHQDALVGLVGQVKACPEPFIFLVGRECPPSDHIIVKSERIHVILQVFAQLRAATSQNALKQSYKKNASNARAAAKELYTTSHFPLAFTQYRSLLSCLTCDKCSLMSATQLHNHTVDLLEKLAVTCLHAGWWLDAEQYAAKALKYEPCSTRARLWLATAHMGMQKLELARAHFALLPPDGHFPPSFPRWIEARVATQRAMLVRMEIEEQGVYDLSGMEKEPKDRVPTIMRSEGKWGIEEVPAGWRTIKGLKKGELLMVSRPIACAPCYVAKEKAEPAPPNPTPGGAYNKWKMMTTRANRTITTPSHAARAPVVGPSSYKPPPKLTLPSKSSFSSLPSTTAKPALSAATHTTTPSTNPTSVHPSSAAKPAALRLDIELDETFALALRADDMFSAAATNAEEASFSTPKRTNKYMPAEPQPEPPPPPPPPPMYSPPNAYLLDPKPTVRNLQPAAPPPPPPAPPKKFGRYSSNSTAAPAPAPAPAQPPPPPPLPTAHTEDPPVLTLALLADTLTQQAQIMPNIRDKVRRAAGRCVRAAEGVIDICGEEVWAAAVVVCVCFAIVVGDNNVSSSKSAQSEDSVSWINDDKCLEGHTPGCGHGGVIPTVHAGHAVYLPMLKLLSVERGKANTACTFVGPYLFLRAAKDLPAGTLLSTDQFPATVHAPRMDRRPRVFALVNTPPQSSNGDQLEQEAAAAAAAAAAAEGGAAADAAGTPKSTMQVDADVAAAVEVVKRQNAMTAAANDD